MLELIRVRVWVRTGGREPGNNQESTGDAANPVKLCRKATPDRTDKEYCRTVALNLTIPSTSGKADPPAETRPRKLKSWLDSLPLVKLHESTREVCSNLGRLNRTKLPAEERAKLLALYQPVLDRLRAELAEEYSTGSLPLSAIGRQASALVRELLLEQAYAQK